MWIMGKNAHTLVIYLSHKEINYIVLGVGLAYYT